MAIGISIIVPCYNCAATLEQAVASIYAQGLPDDTFEVVLVDDCSSDGTQVAMERLAEKHSNIHLLSNVSNLGGGATRNRGISASKGDIIFCLDSDNFFGSGQPLRRMAALLREGNADAAVFEERRFFLNDDPSDFTCHINRVTDRALELRDLFDDSETLLDNFVFTRRSYIKAGGYPEHHGFDTQSFEMRYLASGARAVVCQDTVFYHRQATKKPSYFEREYAAGSFSINYYLCLEDIWSRLSQRAQAEIISFDVFRRNSLSDSLSTLLKRLNDSDMLFSGISQDISESAKNISAVFSEALSLYKSGDYDQALSRFKSLMSEDGGPELVYYNCVRCSAAIKGKRGREIEEEAFSDIKERLKKPETLYKFYHRYRWLNRLIGNYKKWLK